MNIVLRHIEYLLSSHECVIIPGFGAFISNKRPAIFVSENLCLQRPSKEYTFNEELNTSDGLLIGSLARGLKINYSAAQSYVSDFVSRLHSELRTSKEFTFGSIGRIEVTPSGTLGFAPTANPNPSSLLSRMGNIEIADFKKVNIPSINQRPLIEELRPKKFHQYLRGAVGAVAAILIAIVVSTPIPVEKTYKASTVIPLPSTQETVDAQLVAESENISTAESERTEINSVESELSAVKQLSKADLNSVGNNQNEQAVEKAESNKTAVAQPIYTEQSVNVAPRMEMTDSYVLVVASFSSREDAALFIANKASQTDLPLDITESDGRYRVYAATGNTYNTAMANSSNPVIRRHFKQTWATRRGN